MANKLVFPDTVDLHVRAVFEERGCATRWIVEEPPGEKLLGLRTTDEVFPVQFPWSYMVFQATGVMHEVWVRSVMFRPTRLTKEDRTMYYAWLPNLNGGVNPCGNLYQGQSPSQSPGENALAALSNWQTIPFNPDMCRNLSQQKVCKQLIGDDVDYRCGYSLYHSCAATIRAFFAAWSTKSRDEVLALPFAPVSSSIAFSKNEFPRSSILD